MSSVNRLCNPEQVRLRLGLTIEEAPDETVYNYIDRAQKDLRRDIAYWKFDDVLTGTIDGSNTTFSTSEIYIADRYFDNTVTIADIEVYGWTDSDNPATKSSLTITTIYPEYGKVVLSTAPSTSYEQITATYYYYGVPVDFTLIPEACADLAAYYYAKREIALQPQQWMFGAYRFIKSGDYKELAIDYFKKIDRLSGDISDIETHDEATLIRGET